MGAKGANERTDTVSVRVSPREKACLEAAAEAAKLTVSDYIRAGAMLMALMDGNKEAVEITAGLGKERLKNLADTLKMLTRFPLPA